MSIEVELEGSFCVGAQNCVRVAPGAFGIDTEEIAFVADASAATLEQLLMAERQCPGGAIRVAHGGADA